MKVLYDFQAFQYQSFGGVSRYYSDLMNYFIKNKSIDFEVGTKYSNNANVRRSELKKIISPVGPKQKSFESFLPKFKFKGKGRLFNLYCKTLGLTNRYQENIDYTISLLKKQDFDIFHPTYYNPYFLSYLGKKPFVLTVYDMIHELYPEFFPLEDKTAFWKEDLISKATKVIAISENTKNDIVKTYGTDPDKISVVNLCSSLSHTSGNKLEIKNLPKKFILYNGNRSLYKNCYFFLRSMSKLLRDDQELYLIFVGGGKFNSFLNYLIKELGIKNRVKYYAGSDSNLKQLFSKAMCFVYPSLYEGFGIPILEAFEFGCPVVCSNRSSFPEVVDKAGVLFEPKDSNSMIKAVKSVIYDEVKRKSLIELGYKQMKKYSLERLGSETIKVYKSC